MQNVELNENKSYKNILLIPGLGHYEINYVKAIFKLIWHAGLKEFAKMLGFKSPKALSFCESASNHHKSWAMVQIFFKSFSKELVLPYVRHSLTNGNNITVEGYFSFMSSTYNNVPSYIFFYKVVFSSTFFF
jgi:hypothetical protein